jgi:hypothetical protein
LNHGTKKEQDLPLIGAHRAVSGFPNVGDFIRGTLRFTSISQPILFLALLPEKPAFIFAFRQPFRAPDGVKYVAKTGTI